MRFFLLLSIGVALSTAVTAQEGRVPAKRRAPAARHTAAPPSDPAAAAADEGLRMMRAAITTDNFKQFGFESLEEVKRAQIGIGVPLFYVRADDLKSYAPGTDAGRLMKPTARRLYPITVDGQGKLIMTIEYDGSQWKLVDFGQQDIAAQLGKVKQDTLRHSRGPGAAAGNYFAVQVPSVHLSFLAFAPPPGPGGNADTKTQVTVMPLNSLDDMQHSVAFTKSPFLSLNPTFNPTDEGAKSANEVFAAIAPQVSIVTQQSAPQ